MKIMTNNVSIVNFGKGKRTREWVKKIFGLESKTRCTPQWNKDQVYTQKACTIEYDSNGEVKSVVIEVEPVTVIDEHTHYIGIAIHDWECDPDKDVEE